MELESEENALEEGRLALYHLERQLNKEQVAISSKIGSYRKHLYNERKKLDREPRGARLDLRNGSPLGHTIEELDDRGLLDGGGIVPSYYTSMKQKHRRFLEMQSRSSRLQLRGQEDYIKSKYVDAIITMIKFLLKKGLNLRDVFRSYDDDRKGYIEKESFVSILRGLGIPYSSKDFLALAQRYSISSSHADYEAFLRDITYGKDATTAANSAQLITEFECDDSLEATTTAISGIGTPNSFSNLIHDLKRMIRESIQILDKTIDDVYRLFSKWDSGGTGTVTITQFFRVLSTLHVSFPDHEQDMLVELLDNTGNGKIDFDALLSFVFDDEEGTTFLNESAVHSDNGGDIRGEDDTLSLNDGSLENIDIRSYSSGNASRRPHTASGLRRPVAILNMDDDSLNKDDVSNARRVNPMTTNKFAKRPVTASGRVSNVKFSQKSQNSNSGNGRQGIPDLDMDPILMYKDEDINIPPPKEYQRATPPNRQYLSPITFTPTHDSGTGNVPIICPPNVTKYFYQNDGTLEETARKWLIILRQKLISSVNNGMTIKDIFTHFDRRSLKYFDRNDLLEVSAAVYQVTIPALYVEQVLKNIAIDGVDRVCYGELCVFIMDPDHLDLEMEVERMIAGQLEIQGQEYQCLLYSAFMTGTSASAGLVDNNPRQVSSSGVVSVDAFTKSLSMIGISLTHQNITRLVTRFDIHGNGRCSVTRFLQMLHKSEAWNVSLSALVFYEEASEEADVVRRRIQSGSRTAIPVLYDEAIIDMAEYLGIRILSEPHLLWIVEEALQTPLPEGWATCHDAQGRAYFYHEASGVSRWDHPLDFHFRQLRNAARAKNPSQSEPSTQEKAIPQPPPYILETLNLPPRQQSRPQSAKIDYHTPKPSQQRPQSSKGDTRNVDKPNKKPIPTNTMTPTNDSTQKKKGIAAVTSSSNHGKVGGKDRNGKLKEMYADNIVQKLDMVISKANNKNVDLSAGGKVVKDYEVDRFYRNKEAQQQQQQRNYAQPPSTNSDVVWL